MLEGCLKGISVDTKAVEVNSLPASVTMGCSSSCDSAPCQNGGTCIENFQSLPKCHCSEPYSGPTCEIGILISDSTFISYRQVMVYTTLMDIDRTGLY